MRRMRDLTFGHYVATAVPVLAVGFGIYYAVRHHHSAAVGKDATAMKPSQLDHEGKGNRKIANARDHERLRGSGTAIDREEDNFDKDKAKDQIRKLKDGGRDTRKPSSELEGAVNDAHAVGAECAAIEYRGAGPQATKVTKGEWTAVMEQFHGAKHALLGMLEKRRGDMSESTAQALAQQIRGLKIQRPPASDEPDLAWRGVGIYAQSSDGEPMVKMGGGFVHLVTQHPARARFEMARLVAQTLAPCELKRIGASEEIWTPLLKCLGQTESQSCAIGSYSESGWAISTTLAANVANPGCELPAFKAPALASCVSRIPFNKTVAAAKRGPASDFIGGSQAAPRNTASEGVEQ